MRCCSLRLLLLLCGASLVACVIDLPERRFDAGVADLQPVDHDPDVLAADLRPDQQQLCGNGKLDPGESCDTAITAPVSGACPASCDDGEPCTANTLENGGTCQARCMLKLVTGCVGGDGCCPSGCDASSDSDCSSSCGNGTKEALEACDGDCPTSCAPKVCQSGQIVGSAANCAARCLYIPAGEGSPCDAASGSGHCRRGVCCGLAACWDGATCRKGSDATACGGQGEECVDCTASGRCCDSITQLCKTC